MQRLLVTGGLGKLGRPLLMALLQRGYAVRALKRVGDAVPADLDARVEVVTGDVSEPASLQGLATGVDGVLHAAGILQARHPEDFDRVNHQGTRALLAICREAGVKHFLYVSSISVTYPALSAYARSKAAAEAAVLGPQGGARRMACTVVRPTLIYDDAGGAAEFASLVRHVARFPWVALPAGGRARKRPVHAEDAAAALADLLLRKEGAGRVYNLAGSETLTLADMAIRIAEALELKRTVVDLPAAMGMVLARAMQFLRPGGPIGYQGHLGLVHDAAPDIADLQREIGYAPRGFQPQPLALRLAWGRAGVASTELRV